MMVDKTFFEFVTEYVKRDPYADELQPRLNETVKLLGFSSVNVIVDRPRAYGKRTLQLYLQKIYRQWKRQRKKGGGMRG